LKPVGLSAFGIFVGIALVLMTAKRRE